MDSKEEKMMEKGFSRLDELKIKIEDKKYVDYAVNRMANDICEAFFR